MRKPGFRDAVIAMKLYELRREPELKESRDLVRTHILGHDWEKVRELLDEAHPEHVHLRQSMTFWDMAASFVNRGMLHPEIYLDTCDEGLSLYAAVEEHLRRIRKIRPRFASQSEAMVKEFPEIKGRLLELRKEVYKSRKEQDPS